MRRLSWAFIAACFAVGCLSPGETPPWNKPGLGGGTFTKALNDAAQEDRENTMMQADLPAERRHTAPRPPDDSGF